MSKGAETPISFKAVASGSDYAITVPAATTATWAPGEYRWTARAAKGSEVYTVATGTFVVLPDASANFDRRSHAEKALQAITAVLEGRLSDPVVEYEIDGLKARRHTHEDLVKLRAIYADTVRRQRGGAFFRRVSL